LFTLLFFADPVSSFEIEKNTLPPKYQINELLGPSQRENVSLLIDKEYFDKLVHFIRKAKKRIDISMFLFKTTKSPKNKPALLIKELGKARKRGVQVRVILELSDYNDSINKHNQTTAKKLRQGNITVFFDSKKMTTHSKIVVIDSRYSFIGSHNFTHAALAYNNELSLLVDDTRIAESLIHYIDKIVKQ